MEGDSLQLNILKVQKYLADALLEMNWLVVLTLKDLKQAEASLIQVLMTFLTMWCHLRMVIMCCSLSIYNDATNSFCFSCNVQDETAITIKKCWYLTIAKVTSNLTK